MSDQDLRILETVVILAVYAIAVFATRSIINNTLKKAQLHRARRKIIIKAIQLLHTLGAFVLLAGVWGLDQREIAVFASTILTVLGIAFFAQWSLLSNVTSGILLFFNHPLKLGDTVQVFDKDYPFTGEITELSYFFVHIRTAEGVTITIPNSIMFQKAISIVDGSAPGSAPEAMRNALAGTKAQEDEPRLRPGTGE